MVYTFTNMTTSGRPMWAAQHPDTVAVGFGRSKFKAIRQLEVSRASRKNATDAFSFLETQSIDIQEPNEWR